MTLTSLPGHELVLKGIDEPTFRAAVEAATR
jgi:hypothetical protein